jgi:hypothetical protein
MPRSPIARFRSLAYARSGLAISIRVNAGEVLTNPLWLAPGKRGLPVAEGPLSPGESYGDAIFAAGLDRGEAGGPMSKTLFHYTPVVRALKIILSGGVIERSTGKTPPYVWLSSNPTNEPTANRLCLTQEHFRQAGGDKHALFALQRQARFVFHGCDAIPWQNLPLTDADRLDLRLDLDQKGRDKGARPQDWFALPDDVPCRDLRLETAELFGVGPDGVWRLRDIRRREWQEAEQDELKRRYEGLKVEFDGNLS